ncbi:MAG: glycosyltransferase family 39 protein [Dongiaceae bacterium]
MPRLAAAYRVTERLWWGMSPRGIVALIAILTLIRFWVAGNAGLLWDEPYYWMWSQRLAAGYYDHPPMVAYWVWAGTAILGDGPPGIRLLFVLNTVATSAAVYGIGRALFDRRVAWLAVLWTNVTPLIGIAGIMATPDGPSVLFWTLTMVAYAMVVRTGDGRWWLAVGVLAGLGILSKYTNFFLGTGIVLSLLIDPRLRRWFLSPWLWAGGALAMLVFIPVILWNADNNWVSFRFQFGRLGETRFDPAFLITLLIVQPLIFNPYAAVFVGGGVRMWLTGAERGREIGVLLATALPAIAFIVFQATHGEVLQHWLAPVFPTLTVVAVAAAAGVPDNDRHWLLRRIRTDAVPFALLAALVVWAYALLPLDRYYPGIDPLNSVRGWPEYATDVERARQEAGATWIATADYEITAELTYELRDRATVVPVTERLRYTFLPTPDVALLNESALLVVSDHQVDRVVGCFATLTEIGTATRRGAGFDLQTSRLFLAEGAAPDAFARGCDAE